MKDFLFLLYRIKRRIRSEMGMFLGRKKIDRSQKKGEKVLLVVGYETKSIITILQTIYQYRNLSRLSIDLINIADGFGDYSSNELSMYKAIIIHTKAVDY